MMMMILLTCICGKSSFWHAGSSRLLSRFSPRTGQLILQNAAEEVIFFSSLSLFLW